MVCWDAGQELFRFGDGVGPVIVIKSVPKTSIVTSPACQLLSS